MIKHPFSVPEEKRIRLIINTDAKNEADDQYAIVHALLTPRFDISSITAAHFGTKRTETSMQESYDEIIKVLDLMGLSTEDVNVTKGATHAIPSEDVSVPSEGADIIIEEALKDDPRPLYVAFLGPITDLASAYLKNPEIEGKLTALWIGGGQWPDGEEEFNLGNDINAANTVLKSNIPLWIIPKDVYRSIRVSLAELAVNVKPNGKVGEYLYQQLIDLNMELGWNDEWPFGEVWHLGDSPIVTLLLDDHEYNYDWVPAPKITKEMNYIHYQKERYIRWYNYVDSQHTLQDMYAKLKLHYGDEN